MSINSRRKEGNNLLVICGTGSANDDKNVPEKKAMAVDASTGMKNLLRILIDQI
jgi:hypothetical protein